MRKMPWWLGCLLLAGGVQAGSFHACDDGSGVRQTNPRRAVDYLAAPGTPAERTAIDAREMAIDRAWLAMRTSDGIEVAALAPATGVADWLVSEGLAVIATDGRADRICPTLRGFIFADRIAARIVQSWK